MIVITRIGGFHRVAAGIFRGGFCISGILRILRFIGKLGLYIRQAYTCKIPPEECPVLCKRAEFEEQEKAEREKAGGSADPDDCEATNEEEVGDGSN